VSSYDDSRNAAVIPANLGHGGTSMLAESTCLRYSGQPGAGSPEKSGILFTMLPPVTMIPPGEEPVHSSQSDGYGE
jgi:hypothetical protein